MNYKIPYTVENRVHAPELSQVSLDGTIGARFDRLIYERVSGEFAVDEILREAAYDAKVTLRQIEARQQAPDHPILWTVPETDYLNFYLFQVV